MAKKDQKQKTNAMRELDRANISYHAEFYDAEGEDLSRGIGLRIAEELGEDPDQAFKTLVLTCHSGGHAVCCLPVAQELDLKKAAQALGEKSVALLPISEIEQLTGYVRGGVSPVGQRKRFPTLIDETAQLFDQIGISGGKRGLSLRLAPDDLVAFLEATYADICQ